MLRTLLSQGYTWYFKTVSVTYLTQIFIIKLCRTFVLPLNKMADQKVPRCQQINVSDFVNFFLKSGLFIMEGERCALCNWWSDVVMAVLICYLFLYDSFHITFLSNKVNCATCLVSLQEKLFIPLPSESLFCFLWTILVAYVTSLWVFWVFNGH